MPPLPSKKALESMKRADLQKLCKDYGVKANLKSEALIDLLLDTQAAATSRHHPNASNPPAKPPSSRRSVSTRPPSRTGPNRTSSMIIHETDDEDDKNDKTKHEETYKQTDVREPNRPKPSIPGPSRSQPSPTVPTFTRTRKVQESQRRLGVGKPIAAGGAGPRAITRSTTLSRGKLGKFSKSFKPEATIPEEETVPGSSLQPVLQGKCDDTIMLTSSKTKVSSDSLATLADVDEVVANALRPLHEQMQVLRAELEQMNSLKTELVQLRGEVEALKPLNALLNPVTPKSRDPALRKPFGPGSLGMPPSVTAQESTSQSSPHNALGKRPRELSEQDMQGSRRGDGGGSVEKQDDDDLPVSKKAKTSRHDDKFTENLADDTNYIEPAKPVQPGSRAPTFSVFQEPNDPPEGLNEQANTTRLSDYLTIPSPSGTVSAPEYVRHNVTTASALENQNPFTFIFAPRASTPAPQVHPHRQALYSMSSLPFLEAPQSPSPGMERNAENEYSSGDENQTDIYQSFGFPPPGRPTIRIPSTVNPTALTTGKDADVRITSNEVAAGLGLHTISSSSITSMQLEAEDAPPMRITMYGTELDGDTRFGDFGVEGVATGFWTGGRF